MILYIPNKIGSCGMLTLSSVDMQNCNLALLFFSFREGFIACECLYMTLNFRCLNNVVLLMFNAQHKRANSCHLMQRNLTNSSKIKLSSLVTTISCHFVRHISMYTLIFCLLLNTLNNRPVKTS